MTRYQTYFMRNIFGFKSNTSASEGKQARVKSTALSGYCAGLIAAILMFASCNDATKGGSTPEVRTLDAKNITMTTATLCGETLGAESNILVRGVCFSKSELVSFDDRCVSVVSGSGRFEVTTHGLESATTYYTRAFAMLLDGSLVYGDVKNFSTKDEVIAGLSDVTVTDRTISGISVEASIVSPRGEIAEYGFCWSESGVPDIEDHHFALNGISGNAQGEVFRYTLDGFAPGTPVYIRAYATNENGTGYSSCLETKTRSYSYGGKMITVTPPDEFYIGYLGDPSETSIEALYGGAQDGAYADFTKMNSFYSVAAKVSGLSTYRIGEHEVTYEEYVTFLNFYGSGTVKDGSYKGKKLFWDECSIFTYDSANGTWSVPEDMKNHPATGITWFGAAEFCSFYGGFLPNEPQWECAARAAIYTDTLQGDSENAVGSDAGSGYSDAKADMDDSATIDNNMYMYSGSNNLDEVAVYNQVETSPICSKKANALGIYDMSGNAQEWTRTNWFRTYSSVWTDNAPNGKTMVARGGRCQRGLATSFHNGSREGFAGETFTSGKSQYLGFRFCDANFE